MWRTWGFLPVITWVFGGIIAPDSAAGIPKVVFLIHEDEYDTKTTLPRFAAEELEAPLGWRCVFLLGTDAEGFPDLAPLAEADLLVISVRRKFPRKSELERIRAYCASGRPVIGIRTASHAFVSRDGTVPEGRSAWPEFDRDVLGGNYHDHHGNKEPHDPKTCIRVIGAASGHPILRGLRLEEIVVRSWLYKVSPLADSATPLLVGRVGDRLPHEPVAWTNITEAGNRVFYTSLGHPEDFEIPDFRRLLVNGFRWCLELPGFE